MMNNYMYLFDPPRGAMSIQPGKRVTSAQSPLIVYKGDQPYFVGPSGRSAHLYLGVTKRGQYH